MLVTDPRAHAGVASRGARPCEAREGVVPREARCGHASTPRHLVNQAVG